jgi:hypothetical protein
MLSWSSERVTDCAGFRIADILDIGRAQTSEAMYLDLVFVRKVEGAC